MPLLGLKDEIDGFFSLILTLCPMLSAYDGYELSALSIIYSPL